jgi:hypothetical protein
MKRYLQFFMLVVGYCLIQCIAFSQDDINKEYTIKFTGDETTRSKQAKVVLDSIASLMKSQPNRVYMIGSCMSCNCRKSGVIWNRVNNIVTRLVEKYGIAAERFLFRYEDNLGNWDKVYLRYTDERVSTDPPPHPTLRKKITETPCLPASPSSNY